MFGHPCAFVSVQMFMGVFGNAVFVRLPEDLRGELLAEEGAGPFEPMAGRPMKEYVTLPAAWLDEPSRAEPWVARALSYGGSLPPKAPKRKKTAAAAAALRGPAR